MAARQLRHVPVAAAVVAAFAAPALAQHPGRQLESRRAAAPVVYLATVTAVEAGQPASPAPDIQYARATLQVDRVLRPANASPPPAPVTVRYERAARVPDESSTRMAYSLAAGDRAIVFASSFEPSYALEMVAGNAKAVAAEVTAIRAFLAAMDEQTARLHAVTPAIKAQQTTLYDRILAELASPRAR